MNTNELINIGRTGDMRSTGIKFLAHVSNAYQTMLSIFLKQDSIIEKAYVQVKDDNISLAMHGKTGNVFFLKMDSGFLKRTQQSKLPLAGDFLLEGTSNNKILNEFLAQARITVEAPVQQGRVRQELNSAQRNVNVSRRKLNLHGQGESIMRTPVNNVEFDVYDLEIGITGFAIPLVWRPIKGGFGTFSIINTEALARQPRGNSESTSWPITNYLSRTDSRLRDHRMPLTTHTPWIAVNGNYSQPWSPQSTSLIHSMDESIVKNALPNDYDIANLAFLCEMPRNTIRKAFTKIKKSKPFGTITVHYDTLTGKAALVVTNGTAVVQTTSISNNIIYTSTDNIKSASSITYPTWFDSVLSARGAGAPSMNQIQSTENETELFGVTKNGTIVYGLKTPLRTIFTSLSTMETSQPYNEATLEFSTEVKVKKAKQVKVVPAPVLNEPIADATLNDPFYIKWKEVSDQYCTDRNLTSCVVAVQSVFVNYLLQTTSSGGTVTDEDRTAYERLK
jgi:hypothetical protein